MRCVSEQGHACETNSYNLQLTEIHVCLPCCTYDNSVH